MIFVCLGTQDTSFHRLLDMVDTAIKDGTIQEEVIAQAGCTKYTGSHIQCFDYCSSEKMQTYMEQASLIITHGGTGSIVNALKLQKRVIAVNRLGKLGEHTDDHQKEIIAQFVDSGHILACLEEDMLSDKIKESKEFRPSVFVSNTAHILTFLDEYIQSIL